MPKASATETQPQDTVTGLAVPDAEAVIADSTMDKGVSIAAKPGVVDFMCRHGKRFKVITH